MTEPPYDEFIENRDVAEQIRVFPDYIQYNTRCWPCRIDYAKYHYKVEWKKLFVKGFEYAYADFGEKYRQTEPFFFIKDWKFDEKIAEEYKKWKVKSWKRIHEELKKEHTDDPRFQGVFTKEDKKYYIKIAEERTEYIKSFLQWHEFKFDGDSRYSENAKNWIMKKIDNKDFD